MTTETIEKTMTQARKEKLINLVNEFIEERVDYEEYHEDAGEAYAHLPRQGGFDYNNGESRLKKYCEDNFIAYEEGLVDYVLDNVSMESVYVMRNVNRDDSFYVDGYPIQEIEICLDYLISEGKLTYSELMEIESECDAYITGTSRAYVTSDRAWNATISADKIRDYFEK